ncbi:MAG: hypothetical protein ACKESC_01585 [Candidatus Hodgkinia cicadicola]
MRTSSQFTPQCCPKLPLCSHLKWSMKYPTYCGSVGTAAVVTMQTRLRLT